MRSKSPRALGTPTKSSSPLNPRSKSAPNTVSQTPNKSIKSPSILRKSKNETPNFSNFSSNSKIEQIFDFFINEISSKQFFPTQRKKELLDLARASKQNGNRYVTSHKKSSIISTQFWTTWNSFRNQLEQELNKQLTQNQNSLSRNLSILNETVNSIKSSKKYEDIQTKTSEIVEKGSNISNDVEDISIVMNDLKQFQNYIVQIEMISKQQALKYKLTSTISQTQTPLRSIKDILQTQSKFENQFENSNSILEAEIPQNAKNSVDNSLPSKKSTPQKKSNIKSKVPKNSPPSTKKSPSEKYSPASKSPSYKNDNMLDDFEDDSLDEPEIEFNNKRVKPQVSYSKVLNNSKNAAIESEKSSSKNQMSEISKLQAQINLLTEQRNNEDSLPYSVFKNYRKPVQFDLQFELISDLHSQSRELINENYRLNAICESDLKKLSESSMGSLYMQNFELRKQRFKFNEQLFQLKIDNLHTNQILQRATLRPSLFLSSAADNISFTHEDIKQLKKDYSIALKENKDAQLKVASLKEKYEELEKNYINLLKQSYNLSEPFDKSRNSENIRNELDRVKSEYRSEMTKLLFDQYQAQIDSVEQLKVKTNKAIQKLKSKADNDIYSIKLQGESEKSTEQINQINSILQKNIQKISKNEINELTEFNHSLLKWISQIKTQNVDLTTNMKSLLIQYEIMKEKVDNENFDINEAFTEEIQKVREKNQSLKDLLNDSLQKLTQIDVGLGGTSENIPIDQRLQSIVSKMNT